MAFVLAGGVRQGATRLRQVGRFAAEMPYRFIPAPSENRTPPRTAGKERETGQWRGRPLICLRGGAAVDIDCSNGSGALSDVNWAICFVRIRYYGEDF